jgi:inositol-phosphate transport system permease protein
MSTPLAFTDIHSRQTAPVDWDRMAARARSLRRSKAAALYAFLIAVSLPIILPYFWLVTIAFSARPVLPTPWFYGARWPCSCPR